MVMGQIAVDGSTQCRSLHVASHIQVGIGLFPSGLEQDTDMKRRRKRPRLLDAFQFPTGAPDRRYVPNWIGFRPGERADARSTVCW